MKNERMMRGEIIVCCGNHMQHADTLCGKNLVCLNVKPDSEALMFLLFWFLTKCKNQILTFRWPCISVYLSQYLTNLMHKILFHNKFYVTCLYLFRTHVLIIRRSKLHYTASGIITPIGVLFHASTCFEHMCSKHVEAWNKTYCETKFCASSWLNTGINNVRIKFQLQLT